MKLTIIFKDKFEERMKKQFGAFENPQVYGVKSVHTEGAYLCSTISDTVRWRMADISRFYCEEGLAMAEFIKREAVIDLITRRYENPEICTQEINSIPAADVAPVVHARWIHSRYEDCSEQFALVKCSQCNHEAYAMAFYVRGGNYCPNCGAKMDGGADHEAD
nr:MAG TPA: RimK-related lysine biosynthesis protein, Probable-dependent amine/thiol ligase family Amino-group [Caudoviricetes sp.]